MVVDMFFFYLFPPALLPCASFSGALALPFLGKLVLSEPDWLLDLPDAVGVRHPRELVRHLAPGFPVKKNVERPERAVEMFCPI